MTCPRRPLACRRGAGRAVARSRLGFDCGGPTALAAEEVRAGTDTASGRWGRGAVSRARASAFALAFAATAAGVATAATAPRPALHGIALGMTEEQIAAAAHPACSRTIVGDLTYRDPAEGSTIDVGMSGGTPSVALRVVRTFCSGMAVPAVLHAFSAPFGAGVGAAKVDPNGYFFDIGANDEGVLDLSLGRCPDGRRRFQESIRDDKLIVFSLKQARKRKKAADR